MSTSNSNNNSARKLCRVQKCKVEQEEIESIQAELGKCVDAIVDARIDLMTEGYVDNKSSNKSASRIIASNTFKYVTLVDKLMVQMKALSQCTARYCSNGTGSKDIDATLATAKLRMIDQLPALVEKELAQVTANL